MPMPMPGYSARTPQCCGAGENVIVAEWDPARLSRDVTGKVFQAVPNHESHRGSRKQDPLEHTRTNHLSYTNPESLHVIAPRSLPWTPPRRSTRNQRFRTLNKDPAWPSTLAAAASYL